MKMLNSLIALTVTSLLAATSSGDKLPGGQIDFSKAVFDPATGMKCVIEETTVPTIEREKMLECVHKNMEKCHYTYITQFTPVEVRSLKSAETFGRSDNFPT